MPYIDFVLTKAVPKNQADWIKTDIAKIIQQHAGKGEAWLYIRITDQQTLYFKGLPVVDGGIVEVKLVGTLSGSQKQEITSEIGKLLKRELLIQPDQVYVIFTEVKGENWGWNGQMLG